MTKALFKKIGQILTLTAWVALTSLSAQANERHDPGNGHFPNLNLPVVSQGQDAIDLLGADLPAVAASYGHAPDELRGLLTSDPRLHVDRSGRLFYMDEGIAPDAADSTPAGAVVAAAAPYPLANTFLLHSRPGATRVIFLDFDGHVLTGTAWNSTYSTINAPPWDIDGNPSSFGDNERTIIQGIWQRVAEDYLPFDVDVTTEYPGEAAMTRTDLTDTVFGTRVLISPISSYFGSYGGIAYVGCFDYTGDYYKPALVFPEMLGNSEKNIAEAASHEAGHNLGLSHDGTTTGSAYYGGSGTGETGWAPIMGVGYYENLSQWSKGEYANANNTEDDLTVIQSNGLSYRPDDHGNTSATATMLPAGSVLSASGIIERNTDVDVFGFVTGAGTLSLNVNPAPKGPNLDVLIQLFDAAGNLVGTSNPTGVLGASLNLSVAAGTYYLWVRGTGQGDPLTGYSNYDSLGAYTVTGTLPGSSSNVPPLAVAGATPLSGAAPLLVQFNGSQSYDPDGTISTYVWTFGDGGSSTGSVVSHSYSSTGTFVATLKVTDNSGATATSSLTIVVNTPTVNAAPISIANATPKSGTAPLLVSFNGSSSYDSDGTISAYLWTFGDGGSSTTSVVSHTYSSAGTYTATLKVTDNAGGTGTSSVTIVVSAPTVNAAPISVANATPKSGIAPLLVSFNGSSSYDSDGTISAYLWTFGDGGSSTSSVVSHTYSSVGTYTATLKVTDNAGGTGTSSVTIVVNAPTVNAAPFAVANATPKSGTTPLLVSFNGTSSYDSDGTITAYLWTFGDGGSSTSSVVSHTYSSVGTYTATLKVTDNAGGTGTSSVTIVVNAPTVNAAPISVANATPKSGSAPLLVSFNGSSSYDSDGSISLYQWNFGDGGSAAVANPQHTYQVAGNYSATLTVTDNLGATSSATLVISVQPASSTVMHVSNITLTSRFWSAWGNVTGTVTVVDANGLPVPGATVSGSWSGTVSGGATATTTTSGVATFTSGNVKKGGTVTFTISNVAKSGYTYDASHSVTSRSISP